MPVYHFDAERPIDLHTHSNVSDGTESPAAVMRAAGTAGLGTIALTDHDSFDGWEQAAGAVAETGVTLIPGVEISTQIGRASVHLLGYLVDPNYEPLRDELAAIRESRLGRAEKMVARIGADYPLSWDDVLAQAEPGATIGRPHIADALAAKGIVPDRSAAFDTILHWRGGYYQPHHAPHPTTAIKLVRQAGGVPVLAHPGSRGRPAMRDGNLAELIAAGLLGVEIGHRENDDINRGLLRYAARTKDLIVTGSSDYHGTGKSNRLGENTTEPDQLQRIIDAATGCAPHYAPAAPSAFGA